LELALVLALRMKDPLILDRICRRLAANMLAAELLVLAFAWAVLAAWALAWVALEASRELSLATERQVRPLDTHIHLFRVRLGLEAKR